MEEELEDVGRGQYGRQFLHIMLVAIIAMEVNLLIYSQNTRTMEGMTCFI